MFPLNLNVDYNIMVLQWHFKPVGSRLEAQTEFPWIWGQPEILYTYIFIIYYVIYIIHKYIHLFITRYPGLQSQTLSIIYMHICIYDVHILIYKTYICVIYDQHIQMIKLSKFLIWIKVLLKNSQCWWKQD